MKLEAEGQRREAESDAMSPALASLVAELRAEEPPEPAWDEVERRLLARLARGEGAPRPGHGGAALQKLAPIFAAAAAIALAINMGANAGRPITTERAAPHVVEVSSLPHARGPAGDRGDRDLSALRVGDAIESGASPIAFSREGVVRWVLAPASRAVVVSTGAKGGVGVVLSLDRGSIQASVEPRDPSEGLVDAFAIEVSGTRVAVHGTAFTVTRAEQSLVVDVEHGVVAVGPAGHRGATAGYSLVGPSRALFSLDGATKARFLPHDPEPRAARPVAALEPPPLASETKAPAAADPAQERASDRAEHTPHVAHPAASTSAVALSPAPDETKPAEAPAPPPAETNAPPPAPPPVASLTAGTIKARIERCIKDTLRSSLTSTKVSIASTLVIQVNADGAVKSAKLNPPLAPHLAPCAGQAIAGRFASGPSELSIPLSIVGE